MTTAEAVTWVPAYIGLGSNLDDPPRQLRAALDALAQIPQSRLIAVSAFYRNPPLGPINQPDFVNAVAGMLTVLSARHVLAALKGIEQAQGRRREAGDRWGPRVIDLDLLVFGSSMIDEDALVVPHSGITERNFVLFPLLEIAPGLTIPGRGAIGDLAARLDGAVLERLD